MYVALWDNPVWPYDTLLKKLHKLFLFFHNISFSGNTFYFVSGNFVVHGHNDMNTVDFRKWNLVEIKNPKNFQHPIFKERFSFFFLLMIEFFLPYALHVLLSVQMKDVEYLLKLLTHNRLIMNIYCWLWKNKAYNIYLVDFFIG